MKPYMFFCYTAKYFRKLGMYEVHPTPQRLQAINRLRKQIEDEINRVEERTRRRNESADPTQY